MLQSLISVFVLCSGRFFCAIYNTVPKHCISRGLHSTGIEAVETSTIIVRLLFWSEAVVVIATRFKDHNITRSKTNRVSTRFPRTTGNHNNCMECSFKNASNTKRQLVQTFAKIG